MSSEERRLDHIEEGLGPQELVALWVEDAHKFEDELAYLQWLFTQPDDAYPVIRLTNQVEAGVRKRKSWATPEQLRRELYEARREVIFLFYVHQQMNERLVFDEQELRLRFVLAIEHLRTLLGALILDSDILKAQRIYEPSQKPRRGRKEDPYPFTDLNRWLLSAGKGGLWGQVLPTENRSFRELVVHWKTEAETHLSLVLRLRLAAHMLGRRYLAGREILYPRLALLLAGLEKESLEMVQSFEELFAKAWELERPKTKKRQAEVLPESLCLDQARLREEAQAPAKELAAYLADMARAMTLRALGDRMGAAGLVERYLR